METRRQETADAIFEDAKREDRGTRLVMKERAVTCSAGVLHVIGKIWNSNLNER